MAYTLDILMTNIKLYIWLESVSRRPMRSERHDFSLHQYASSCCRIHQRSSSLTQPYGSARQVFKQLQCFWWSHCVASFLPSPQVRSMSSCSGSTLLGRNGASSKDESLHDLCCSGIGIGEHNHNPSHRQLIGRTIQQMVLDTAIPTDALVDPQVIRRQVLLPHDEALQSRHVPQHVRGIMRGQQLLRRRISHTPRQLMV